MESPTKDIFNVLDEFIAAVEETKEVLRSPSVSSKTNSCRERERKPGTRRDLGCNCECNLLQRRLAGSEGELHRFDQKLDATLSFDEGSSREAEGLVTEMNSLLNQISSAATSLKKMYHRRSAPVMHDI